MNHLLTLNHINHCQIKVKKRKKKRDRPIPVITRVNSNSNEVIIPQPRASQIEKNTPQLNRSHSHNPFNNPPIHNYNLLEEDNKYLLFNRNDLELVEKINEFW